MITARRDRADAFTINAFFRSSLEPFGFLLNDCEPDPGQIRENSYAFGTIS